MQQHGPTSLLQQDTARPHTANVTRQFYAQNNVNVLDWPANSPDLSPIEHIWDELGRRVRKDGNIHTINDQAAALQRDWNTLTPAFIQRYVRSMRRQILTCIAANE